MKVVLLFLLLIANAMAQGLDVQILIIDNKRCNGDSSGLVNVEIFGLIGDVELDVRVDDAAEAGDGTPFATQTVTPRARRSLRLKISRRMTMS